MAVEATAPAKAPARAASQAGAACGGGGGERAGEDEEEEAAAGRNIAIVVAAAAVAASGAKPSSPSPSCSPSLCSSRLFFSLHSLLLLAAARDCSRSKVISEIAENGAAPSTAAERPR